MELSFGKVAQIILGVKNAKKMYNTKSKSYLMWGICLKASFNHISMV